MLNEKAKMYSSFIKLTLSLVTCYSVHKFTKLDKLHFYLPQRQNMQITIFVTNNFLVSANM